MAVWTEVSTLPYSSYRFSAVVLDEEIHILGGTGNYTKHYKYSNGSWTEVSTLPYGFHYGSAVVLDEEIHILGSYSGGYRTEHYKYSNGSWTKVSTLPYEFYYGSAVVLDGEIHILGSYLSGYRDKHYKYSNGSWIEVSTLPYNFYDGSAVVLDGEIHILGGAGNYTTHYKYSNRVWIRVSTLPYSFYEGAAVVLDGEIHILGCGFNNNYTKHYKYLNGVWIEVSALPYDFNMCPAVILDEEIHILGTYSPSIYRTKHYKYYTPINKVVYGDKTLIDLTSDTVNKDKLGRGYTAHEKHGGLITGTADILTCAKKVVVCRNNRTYAAASEKELLNLNDTIVYLSYSGANILLTAGSSSITIASPGANYVATFYISSVHYINRNQAIITYRYETNESGLLSRFFIRLITLKSNGTLAQSSQINGSAAPTAKVNMEGYIIPMFEAKTSWMLIYTATTISTGATAIYVSRMYAALASGTLTIPSSSTWTTVAASNVNTAMPSYFNDYFSEYGGLLFYDGANAKAEVDIWAGYSGGNKDVYTSAAGDVADLVGVNCHILGKTSDGYLAIYYEPNYHIYLYSYDPVTCYFSQVAFYAFIDADSISHPPDLLYLLNNGLLLYIKYGEPYKIYTLTRFGLELFASDFTYIDNTNYPASSEIGPLSDPFQGIFIS